MTPVTFIMSFRDPVRNVSDRMWRRCLDSIQQQAYPHWKAILVDDASIDGSADVIKEHNDPRFMVVRNDQSIGLTRSMNKALAMVDTPLVARHDSDDWSDPQRLTKEVDFLTKNPQYGIVGSYSQVINKKLRIYDRQIKPIEHASIISRLRKENPFIHGSVLMKTDILKQLGGYDETFYVCQDYDLWCRMAKAGVMMHNIPEFLYYRMSHPNCVTKKTLLLRKVALARIRRVAKTIKKAK